MARKKKVKCFFMSVHRAAKGQFDSKWRYVGLLCSQEWLACKDHTTNSTRSPERSEKEQKSDSKSGTSAQISAAPSNLTFFLSTVRKMLHNNEERTRRRKEHVVSLELGLVSWQSMGKQ